MSCSKISDYLTNDCGFSWQYKVGRDRHGDRMPTYVLLGNLGRIWARIYAPSTSDEYAYSVSLSFSVHTLETWEFDNLDEAKNIVEALVVKAILGDPQPTSKPWEVLG